jgi:hypothetical protein
VLPPLVLLLPPLVLLPLALLLERNGPPNILGPQLAGPS